MKSAASPVTPIGSPQWHPGTLLAELSPDCRDELLGLARRERHKNGEILMHEGDHSTHVVILLEGLAKVTAGLENGRTALLGIRVGGDIVGEMAALENSPRSATLTAFGDLDVGIIPQSMFLTFLRRWPDANFALTKMIARRLRWANHRRVDFNGYPARIRLARVLVALSVHGHPTDNGIAIDFGLAQHEFGALAGTAVDTASEELRDLKAQGIIHYGYRGKNTVICDMQALKAIAQLPD